MRRRVLYLWLPRLATDRAIGARPALADTPFVVIQPEGNRIAVVAVNRAGELAGGAPGQSLSDARSLCPTLQAVPAEPDADRRLLARLAEACGRYTPWVGLDPAAAPFEGGLVLDITGCAHLVGGESDLIRRLTGLAARLGLGARAAIADTPGAAWAWARFGDPTAPILAGGAHRSRLAPLPVAALRLAEADIDTLHRLGLYTVGALAALPRAAVALRFGDGVLRRLGQARGDDPEPVSPLRPVTPHAVDAAFGEPLATPEAVAAGLDRLLEALAARLGREGLGARRLAFTLHRIDGTAATARIGVSRATRNAGHLRRLFAPRLETLDPDPGVETLRLEAASVERIAADQADLRMVDRPGGPAHTPVHTRVPMPASVTTLVDRLANRLGPGAVTWAEPVETPLPEEQTRSRPALAGGPADWAAWPAGAPRPVRLRTRPDPVDPLPPDGPGAATPPAAFTWKHEPVRLRRAEGPERLAGPWWRQGGRKAGGHKADGTAAGGEPPEPARHRDYWLAEDTAGRRLWLFRDLITGRWAVHGLRG